MSEAVGESQAGQGGAIGKGVAANGSHSLGEDDFLNARGLQALVVYPAREARANAGHPDRHLGQAAASEEWRQARPFQ